MPTKSSSTSQLGGPTETLKKDLHPLDVKPCPPLEHATNGSPYVKSHCNLEHGARRVQHEVEDNNSREKYQHDERNVMKLSAEVSDKSKQDFVIQKPTLTRRTASDWPKKCPAYVARYPLQRIMSAAVRRVYHHGGLIAQ